MINSRIINNHFPNLVYLYSSLFYGSIEHYKKMGLQFVDVPAIVGVTGACENVDTLFKVGNRLGLPLFFTQTGQLALEQSLQYSHGVYTIIHSGRDEETEDERHLRQFRLTEEEFDCTLVEMTRENYNEEKMYEALLEHIEKATKAMVESILGDHKKLLEEEYQRQGEDLKEIITRPYLRLTYEEALNLLQKNGYPDLMFGDDFDPGNEAKIIEIVNKSTKGYGKSLENFSPVLILKYPKEIKFFNMKVSTKDPRVVLSADCLFPYSGEAVGSAVREPEGVRLIVRLLTSNMYRLHEKRGGSYEDFKWYTEGMILSKKTLPHAGYGIGNERLMQFILGLKDIRQASIFYHMNKETKDWEPKTLELERSAQPKETMLVS